LWYKGTPGVKSPTSGQLLHQAYGSLARSSGAVPDFFSQIFWVFPVVNSRDVARHFEKRHDNVLRDIEAICHASELRDGWFREIRAEHPTVAGRFDRSFDLTRQGFTLLVMGWLRGALRLHTLKRITARMGDHSIIDGPPDNTLHVRVSPDLRQALERDAARECRTVSQQVRFLLSVAMQGCGASPPVGDRG
jgi:Rha family phage regulatory protein